MAMILECVTRVGNKQNRLPFNYSYLILENKDNQTIHLVTKLYLFTTIFTIVLTELIFYS